MARHRCSGDGCGYCERRIAEIEYERDYPDEVHDYFDGT
ncbi:hypothetical protein SEA_HURRICANE_66 [Mycobacterium phage Hurricane]|uniref:Uncharacterized protein n=1 Tax=Mycobacterium phage Hurricane TaxID=2015810 RepID=A0A222ZKU9_9CAUD|nr:hypothetical protein I5G83_gp66 [Mycobacterium phage Hurricane]ASR84811.1 hypothetical protein SEA_HURRICANE_66 [Mycobacterium phage Hurricane]